ncbi:uncharacterized protein LOC126988379 isoform X2 [Eriocheir sinensis]|uniref:uncharacterized protein LOC126988379 isoform X2 n=1 Tax=Eriocheir sinensis TaxID=95602 RepID=UPI0021C7A963|nr:uncharacterized protein LOC126988379 isoform X2 [Eriocheir sinensis]
MKALACASVVVVLLLAGVQTHSHPGGHGPPYARLFFDYFLSEFCEGIEDTCQENIWDCLRDSKPEPIQTEEQLTALKNNLTACAEGMNDTDADFSDLTLATLKQRSRLGELFNPGYGVSSENVGPLIRCMMEKDGKLETIKTCTTGI